MRCPYCGGLNSDRSSFCTYCGRDLTPPVQANTRQQPPQQPPQQPGQQLAQSPFQPPRRLPPQRSAPPPQSQRPAPTYQPPQQPPPVTARQAAQPMRTATPPVSQTTQMPQLPEPPAPFPPRTVEQLKALEVGALPYTLAHDAVGDGRKKIVQIVYRPSTQWQQVATLLKAFKEQQAEKYDTIIVQGVPEQDNNPYSFVTGQLRFDRNVRLGSQTINRYQIETGNGFESDSIRIVLSE